MTEAERQRCFKHAREAIVAHYGHEDGDAEVERFDRALVSLADDNFDLGRKVGRDFKFEA